MISIDARESRLRPPENLGERERQLFVDLVAGSKASSFSGYRSAAALPVLRTVVSRRNRCRSPARRRPGNRRAYKSMGQRAGEGDEGTGRAVDATAAKPAGESAEQSDPATAIGT